MNQRREKSDSLPDDLISEIFLRLPANSIARFRILSKQWGSTLHQPYFKELFLTRSRDRPRILFVVSPLKPALRSGEYSFYSSPQLNPHEESFIHRANFHLKFPVSMSPFLADLTYGLAYFSGMQISPKSEYVRMVCNPRTRQYVNLPKLSRDQIGLSGHSGHTFIGFDPIGKQFKLLKKLYYEPEQHFVMTLENGKMRWREIKCQLNNKFSQGSICVNGVLYYNAYKPDNTREIVCFDVRSEKFEYIDTKCFSDCSTIRLINYKGKLGVFYLGGDNPGKLSLWVLEDVKNWSKYVYNLDMNLDKILRESGCCGVTATGDIVICMEYTYKPFFVYYFNPERNTLRSVKIQGFEDESSLRRVHAYIDHVEDLNVNDAIQLKSSRVLDIIRRRPKQPKPKKKKATLIPL
ncbi:unnamed protein product [Cochlearia groenlandica]